MLENLINPEKLMEIGVYVLAVNLMLSGLYKGLELIKDKTKTETDNKVYAALGKVLTALTVLADWVAPKSKK